MKIKDCYLVTIKKDGLVQSHAAFTTKEEALFAFAYELGSTYPNLTDAKLDDAYDKESFVIGDYAFEIRLEKTSA